MCSEFVIAAENLSKCYQIYDKPRDRLFQMLLRGHKQYYKEFWALKNVNFTIKKGETVGIIGRNGSGKSTLLQLICGTLNPTEGNVVTKGRVAALLELGSGFNPEFTGRENVYMNASVLGLNNKDIDAIFHDIITFADIGYFIEQPVKTYSSGMMIRLAFAVAINIKPEILIIDEALSVGDELFQRKCFAKIESIRSSGATILFVSHSASTVVDLCDRAILLDCGEKLQDDIPKYVVENYQRLIYAPKEKQENIRNKILGTNNISNINDHECQRNDQDMSTRKKSSTLETYDSNLIPTTTVTYIPRGATISSIELTTKDGILVNNIVRGNRYIYKYNVIFNRNVNFVRFGMLIKTITGVELGGCVSANSTSNSIYSVLADTNYNVEFDFSCDLNPGVFFLNTGVVGVVDGEETYVHRIIDAYMFRVINDSENFSTSLVDFRCKSKIEKIS